MNRTALLALAATVAVGATAKLGFVDPPVNLQATSPGTQQVGSANISGKLIAGSVGASNASPGGQAVFGEATGTGSNFGGLFKSSSSSGTGVRGVALATTGVANGGTFQTASSKGSGVLAVATSTSGDTFGGFFRSASSSGVAVQGEAISVTGNTIGGLFLAASPSGIGLSALNDAGGVGLRTESSGRALDVVGGSAFSGTAVFNASPPFAVTSNAHVLGLNADLLDGLHSVDFGVRASSQAWNGVNRFNAATSFGGPPTSRMVHVVGDADITGDLKVGTLNIDSATRIMVFGPHDFANAFDSIPDPNLPVLEPNSSKSFFAPVHLPEGATVTRVGCYAHDLGNSSVTVFLIRRQVSNGVGGGTMAQASTIGSSFNGEIQDETISAAVVDNVNFTYFLRVDVPGSGYFAASASITYTVTKPLP